jgi:GH24 family phage-related lysozyme (muramidase)
VLSTGPAASGELELTDRALALILAFEGMSQPANWPGEMSGITIGHGYDLGYRTHDEFFGDWGTHLSEAWMERLAEALGKRGAAAQRIAPRFSDIRISRKAADAVFLQRTIPEQVARTAAAFPGAQALPPECQGALVSLVYNRGTSMQGARRREMREIRDCVADPELPVSRKLETIAASLESMKRLWPNSRGLRRRRDAEAALVRMAV